MGTHSADEVAAEIRRRLPGVEVKKLHKLLYYCQGHHLGTVGEALFAEDLQAWDRGPVVATLWRDEHYGTFRRPAKAAFDEAELNTIGYVMSRYGAMTGADLEALTHNETPWMLADDRRESGGSQVIAKAEIRAYFAAHQPSDESDEDDDFAVDPAKVDAWLSGAAGRRTNSLARDDRATILALAKR